MTVIINDFEVLMDQPQPSDSAGTASQSPPAPTLRPDDIERIQRHYEQRKLRVAAD